MNNDLNEALIERANSVTAILYVMVGTIFTFGFIIKIVLGNCGV